jgi:hypothetical protein
MPKYMISCTTKKHYYLVVDAADENSAMRHYNDNANGTDFHTDEDEYGWEFDDIEKLPADSHATVDVRVDNDGFPV